MQYYYREIVGNQEVVLITDRIQTLEGGGKGGGTPYNMYTSSLYSGFSSGPLKLEDSVHYPTPRWTMPMTKIRDIIRNSKM
jgi:hypothetical protein